MAFSVILIMLTIIEAGCSGKTDKITQSSSVLASESHASEVGELKEPLGKIIGKWKIDNVYAYGEGGSRNDEEDIKNIIGMEITLSLDSIQIGSEMIQPIYYQIEDSSSEDFYNTTDWLRSISDLDVDKLKLISIYKDKLLKDLFYGDEKVDYYTNVYYYSSSNEGELYTDIGGDLFHLIRT
ncbi:hypothetical protein H8B09_19200 [Paenibacillus sp. PR3]|uniref:Uncharacterized protein n=1 Tax=Paenibacillus terricola TaxID=2763503 RepID=A0ABR8N0X0_9BACL|nr:hypothetical protein [Paenibacillus terricola]MBD3920901.1 hypothetical protein [Paenibacillus terricola]